MKRIAHGLALLVPLGLAAPGLASAATFTVTKTADTADGACDADCSLREAVIAANADPTTTDVILVPAGTYTLTIPGPDPADNDEQTVGDAAVGDLDLLGPTYVIGQGPSPTDTVIDANGAVTGDRAFHALAVLRRVELRNLTVQGGQAANRRGGGVYGFRSHLVIDGCVVRGNAARYGAGVALQTKGSESGMATLDIRNSTVAENTAAGTDPIGGGVFAGAGAAATISNSTVSDNVGARLGGGLGMSVGASLEAVGSSFERNAASNSGGGLHVGGLGATLRRCLVAGNTANNGGGVSANSEVTLVASVLRGNTAAASGGGFSSGGGALTAIDTAFEDNEATGNVGGGISGGKVTLRGCTVAGNSAQLSGGGLYLTGGAVATPTVDIENSTITGNHAAQANGDNGNRGAGVVMSRFAARSLRMTNTTVADNVSGGLGQQLSCFQCAGGWTLRNVVVKGSGPGSQCYWGGPADPQPLSEGGNVDAGTDCGFAHASDVSNADTALAALADNGGLTRTRALQPGSDALGAGATCPTNDQRGFVRAAETCDSGAYEALTPAGATAFSCGGSYEGVAAQLDYIVEDLLPDAAANVGDAVFCLGGIAGNA